MEPLLLESAVRAALIAAGTSVVLWAFGIKAAAGRHRAWTGVLLLMLLLPIWTAAGPKVLLKVLRPAIIPDEARLPPALNKGSGAIRGGAAEQAGELLDTRAISEPAKGVYWRMLLPGIYLLGASVLLLRLALGTVRARRLIRSAVTQDGRLISESCASPLTVGWLRPVVILPRTWQRWPKAQLDAVLTHEREHARRYDPLVQWLALLNRAVFWFHPLAWWLERQLGALAEAACDTAVLAAGHSPQDYCEYLLDLARSTMGENGQRSLAGMAMPGRYLARRIQQIFEGVPMKRISRTRIACTSVLCSVSSVIFAAATLAPQQIHPVDSGVASASTGITPAPAQAPAPPAQEQTRPALLSPPAALRLQFETVSTTRQQHIPEENIPLSSLRVLPQRGGAVPPDNDLSVIARRRVRLESVPGTEGWWPNPAVLARLGLTGEQTARIERTLEVHRQNIDSNSEQLEKEEAQFARLLEAEPLDRGAVLTQLDRVIQARNEMVRANAAMTIEMREYLTHAQWMQLQTSPSWFSRGGGNFWIRRAIQAPAAGAGTTGEPRGGRGQQ